MMDAIETLKQTWNFTFSDLKTLLYLGCIYFIMASLNTFSWNNNLLNIIKYILSHLFLFLSVGYGSYISLYTLKYSDTLPKFKHIKKLIWEGIKKSTIIAIYFFIMDILRYIAEYYLEFNHIEIYILLIILSALTYIVLVLALSNRYLRDRKFLEAFNFKHIFLLFRHVQLKKFILVVILVMFSHIFVISCYIDSVNPFGLFELPLSFITFILTPFLYVFNKRLIAIHIREMFEDIQ